jgi:ribosomal protein L4
MGNTASVKYNIPVTIRVDQEFVEAVKELRRAADDPPTKADIIRRAVLNERDRERKAAEKKRNSR